MAASLIGDLPDAVLFLIMLAVIIALTVCLLLTRKKAGMGRKDTAEAEYQKRLRRATEGLYENIFEMDITHNCAYGKKTKAYFKSLGIPEDAPYFDALKVIAQKQIREDFVQGYLDMFESSHVIESYRKGNHNLTYEFMMAADGENYRWLRINAQIFFWKSDQSLHLISYRQNIDAEKAREISLLEKSQTDLLSGLYNKKTVEEIIARSLAADAETESRHAFFLFDIDNFKTINDNLGHSFGDLVIKEFCEGLKSQFRDTDIVGRVGGDEFVVFMKNCGDNGRVREKLAQACMKLSREYCGEKKNYAVSASVGAALFPEHGKTYAELYEKADKALYISKGRGKNTFNIYDEEAGSDLVFRAHEKDLKALTSAAADGISKIAFSKDFKMLYFDAQRAKLTNTPLEVMRDPNFNVLAQFYQPDVPPALEVFYEAMTTKEPFTVYLRLRHADGHYLPVRLRGLFVNELYNGKDPIFYALYTDLTDVLQKAEEGKFLPPEETE